MRLAKLGKGKLKEVLDEVFDGRGKSFVTVSCVICRKPSTLVRGVAIDVGPEGTLYGTDEPIFISRHGVVDHPACAEKLLRECDAADDKGQNAVLLEFVQEVAKGPYKDSDIEELYKTHVARAKQILKELGGTPQ